MPPNVFIEISLKELAKVAERLPDSTAGWDGVTSNMLKIFFKEYPDGFLNLANHSVKTFVDSVCSKNR